MHVTRRVRARASCGTPVRRVGRLCVVWDARACARLFVCAPVRVLARAYARPCVCSPVRARTRVSCARPCVMWDAPVRVGACSCARLFVCAPVRVLARACARLFVCSPARVRACSCARLAMRHARVCERGRACLRYALAL